MSYSCGVCQQPGRFAEFRFYVFLGTGLPVMLVFCVVPFVSVVVEWRMRSKLEEHGLRTEAVVVASETRNFDDYPMMYRPIYELRLSDGTRTRIRGEYSEVVPQMGDHASVLVNLTNPSERVIGSREGWRFKAIVLGAATLPTAAFPFALLYGLMRTQIPRLRDVLKRRLSRV